MTIRIFLSVTLLVAATCSCESQVADPGDNAQMQTPPPVNGQAYPTAIGAEVRSNYLRGGLIVNTSYVDNLYPGAGSTPLAESIVMVNPTIALDETTVRQHRTLTYSTGYTFYQPSSGLNEIDQNAILNYSFRLTAHASIIASNTLRKSSTAFTPAGLTMGGTVAGSVQPAVAGIIAPFAEQLSNSANTELTIQVSRNSMIGMSGGDMLLNYPNPSEAPGLYNWSARSGSGFFNRRISRAQYVGVNYQYSQILSYPAHFQSETQTHTLSGYYTIYPQQSLSISVSGGPQYFEVAETGVPTQVSWTPSINASMGWQGLHTNLAASVARDVTAGGGLLGAYHSDSATASARWQVSRVWSTGSSVNYGINKSVAPSTAQNAMNGHSLWGAATISHSLGPNLSLNIEYDRLTQSYGAIAAIARNPVSNRETISISWQFMRPLGR